MIMTIQIHYDYDENEGILPSGLPAGPAFCSAKCPHLIFEGPENNIPFCDLFNTTVQSVTIGTPERQAYAPSHQCRHYEMQSR